MRLAVLNLSAAEDADVEKIAEVMEAYLEAVCSAYELAPIAVEWMPKLVEAPTGFVPCVALNHPDTSGALGYHSRDPRGRAYARSFLDVIDGRFVLRDPSGKGGSLAGTMLHEAAETAVDRSARAYLDAPFRHDDAHYAQVALEVCDPVQETASTLASKDGTLVDAPNFVYPRWFDDEAQPGEQLDWMGAVPRPLAMLAGGYVIARGRAVADSDVFARHVKCYHASPPAPWRDRLKRHASSRVHRREEMR